MPEYIFDVCVAEWKSVKLAATDEDEAREKLASLLRDRGVRQSDLLEQVLRTADEHRYDLHDEL